MRIFHLVYLKWDLRSSYCHVMLYIRIQHLYQHLQYSIMLYIRIPEYSIFSIGYWHNHISIYNIDIHVTSGHIFSGKYGHICTIKVFLVSQSFYCVSFHLFRFFSLCFVSLIFAKMTFSRNTKFRENALYFREITKFVSLPFRENFAKRNSVKNPTPS